MENNFKNGVVLGDDAARVVARQELDVLDDTTSQHVPCKKVNNITPLQISPIRTQGNLPHWHVRGAIQFVTFRLSDSLPQEKLNMLKVIKEDFVSNYPEPWEDEVKQEYYNQIDSRCDEWLGAGCGSCLLRDKAVREILVDCLWHGHNNRYIIHTFVIMPNHVHVLFEPIQGNSITDILHTWKSYSAHQINKLLNRKGSVWQRESYDRVIRNEKHYQQVWQYIQNNPRVLRGGEYTLCGLK